LSLCWINPSWIMSTGVKQDNRFVRNFLQYAKWIKTSKINHKIPLNLQPCQQSRAHWSFYQSNDNESPRGQSLWRLECGFPKLE
jgi:hypothetical protein